MNNVIPHPMVWEMLEKLAADYVYSWLNTNLIQNQSILVFEISLTR